MTVIVQQPAVLLPRGKTQKERSIVTLKVTSHFPTLSTTFRLNTRDAKKLTMKQTKLLTRSDIRGFTEGKTPPIRPTRFTLSFIIPVEEIEKHQRKLKRQWKRSGMEP